MPHTTQIYPHPAHAEVNPSGGTNGAAYRQPSTLLRDSQYTELQPGLIYVMRRVNGTDVPLLIRPQHSYKEWVGCFSAIC